MMMMMMILLRIVKLGNRINGSSVCQSLQLTLALTLRSCELLTSIQCVYCVRGYYVVEHFALNPSLPFGLFSYFMRVLSGDVEKQNHINKSKVKRHIEQIPQIFDSSNSIHQYELVYIVPESVLRSIVFCRCVSKCAPLRPIGGTLFDRCAYGMI